MNNFFLTACKWHMKNVIKQFTFAWEASAIWFTNMPNTKCIFKHKNRLFFVMPQKINSRWIVSTCKVILEMVDTPENTINIVYIMEIKLNTISQFFQPVSHSANQSVCACKLQSIFSLMKKNHPRWQIYHDFKHSWFFYVICFPPIHTDHCEGQHNIHNMRNRLFSIQIVLETRNFDWLKNWLPSSPCGPK